MSGFGRFSLPLVRPLRTAAGAIESREGFLVRLGEDPVGIGEATPLAGWTEGIDDCRRTLRDHLDRTALDELPVLEDAPAARHGLELALLDRASREQRVPLYRMLGGERRVSTVPVNATIGGEDPDETVARSRTAIADGFGTIKLKLGSRPVDEDLAVVEAVRDAIGEGPALRIDVNGSWDRDQAAAALEPLAEHDVSVVEQPLDPRDLSGHRDLRGSGPAVALDESLRAPGLEAVLDADAADLVVLKPMVLGGVGRAKQLAEAARGAGLGVIVTTTIDAAVARTAAVHLAAAIDPPRGSGLATADWLETDVGSDPATVVDGGMSVPQGAGHGVGLEDLK